MKTTSTLSKPHIVVPVLVAGVLAIVLVAVLVLPSGAEEDHDHGDPDVVLLTERSSSPDDISAKLRLKLDGRGANHVMNMKDVDHLVLAELTFAPGDLVDWHTHPGPVIVIVDEGVLTVTSGGDCVARDYGPDELYIEQGPRYVLRVENLPGAATDTVIYALFFELPDEGPLTLFKEDPGC
jgi:quercetin dioxygenase-like cupin family protein